MLNIFLKNKTYILVFTFLLFIGCGETSEKNTTVLGTTKDYTKINLNEQELLNAINKARSVARDCYPNNPNYGQMGPVHDLYWSTELYSAALEHSTDLAYSNTFSHNGSGTEFDITGNGSPSSFDERILANGYADYYSVGENIAGGQESIEDVMAAWLASPKHCSNIMSDKYTEVGVAIVTNSDSTYGIYWTQNFGSKLQ